MGCTIPQSRAAAGRETLDPFFPPHPPSRAAAHCGAELVVRTETPPSPQLARLWLTAGWKEHAVLGLEAVNDSGQWQGQCGARAQQMSFAQGGSTALYLATWDGAGMQPNEKHDGMGHKCSKKHSNIECFCPIPHPSRVNLEYNSHFQVLYELWMCVQLWL